LAIEDQFVQIVKDIGPSWSPPGSGLSLPASAAASAFISPAAARPVPASR
jgi:hypothetical protein